MQESSGRMRVTGSETEMSETLTKPAAPVRPPRFNRNTRKPKTFPAGPSPRFPGQFLMEMARNPLGPMLAMHETYGDIVHYKAGPQHLYLFNDPELIRDVLVTNQKNFTKSRGLERARKLLGNGLLTSEGEFHLRQRRLAQPAFQRQRIATYATTMTSYADRTRSSWRDGSVVD